MTNSDKVLKRWVTKDDPADFEYDQLRLSAVTKSWPFGTKP